MAEEQLQLPDAPKIRWLMLAACLIVGVWFVYWWAVSASGWDSQSKGTFGDMFGGLNTLFSGLAFAALAFTLWQQRAELAMQRRELELTRAELSGQREQMKLQGETMKLQRFESTFFQLLQLHNTIVSSIDLQSKDGVRITRGRDCFTVFGDRLRDRLKYNRPSNNQHTDISIDEVYLGFYEENETNIGHYFRSLYNILKFIDTSGLQPDQRRLYSNLVRAQLSAQELYVLFFNSLSKFGQAKMKPLVERYSLLKHVNRVDIHESGGSLHFFSSTATN